MLNRPGDLIPVTDEAKLMTWSNRSSKIVEFLHRGPVTFSTLVYDTNVGDIATIASYFNPEMVSLEELNSKYAQRFRGSGQEQKEEVQVPQLTRWPLLLITGFLCIFDNSDMWNSSTLIWHRFPDWSSTLPPSFQTKAAPRSILLGFLIVPALANLEILATRSPR